MCQIVESIRIENKTLQNIDLHNNRFLSARKQLFGQSDFIEIEKYINIPDTLSDKRYKCRLTYDGKTLAYTIKPYTQRVIRSLRLVHDDEINYSVKTNQRHQLDRAYEQREGCDDIIIVKNGYLSDTWAANIILYYDEQWYTSTTPLLKGIQREYLLRSGRIKEIKIREHDLWRFSKIKLINAMIDFERAPSIDITTGVFG
jgi:4-amino-4-deoxychorismate lyase